MSSEEKKLQLNRKILSFKVWQWCIIGLWGKKICFSWSWMYTPCGGGIWGLKPSLFTATVDLSNLHFNPKNRPAEVYSNCSQLYKERTLPHGRKTRWHLSVNYIIGAAITYSIIFITITICSSSKPLQYLIRKKDKVEPKKWSHFFALIAA